MSKMYDSAIATKLYSLEKQIEQKDKEIARLEKRNKRLENNQVRTLNKIRDFISMSKCEVIEGHYSNDRHSEYWILFQKFAEELKGKIKGIEIDDYVRIPKWREKELLDNELLLIKIKRRNSKAYDLIDYHKYNDGFNHYRVDNVEEVQKILRGDNNEQYI